MRLVRRNNPTHPLHTTRRLGFDSLLDDFFAPALQQASSLQQNPDARFLSPRIDVSETDNAYQVEADLPGVDRKDIEVTFEENVLSIKAGSETNTEQNTEEADAGSKALVRERVSAQYLRRLRLRDTIDENAIEANYENGVLQLKLPKLQPAEPEKFRITVN